MKKLLSTLMLSSTLSLSSPASAEPVEPGSLTLSGTVFEQVASTHQLDSLLLYSLAIVESATGAGNGNIRPYPYVLRTADGAFFYKTRIEAEHALSAILRQTSNVDVGMMQINLYYHPQTDPLSLLDPQTNLVVAAKYLKKTMASTPDPVLGVGRYHNWGDHQRAVWYGNRVWQVYRNLAQLKIN
ncbi:transglycosylase SLT domain-containing protein [Maricurvus nonylphenolicus]|uniref:transglycosylase SLT domain-containing protein n=1 Tax=Maricurvus nonylphenolicus TaxID=1008307 RepID=UPI0036F393DD